MKLETYLQNRNESPADFARRTGIDPATLSRYVSGVRIPRRATMEAILVATEGEVTPNDFYSVDAT